MKRIAVMCAVLLLAACGGGSKDQGPMPPVVVTPPVVTPPVVTPPVVTPPVDAYLAQVETTAATMPHDTDAANDDAVLATAPEDAEPKPL